jgi:hypothetical protein
MAARECGTLCVPASLSGSVIDALQVAAAHCDECACRIQTLEAPSVFSHQRQAAKA